MDQKVINEAVENISIIKGVIERTGKTFVGFSRIFICWGFLFTFLYTGFFLKVRQARGN